MCEFYQTLILVLVGNVLFPSDVVGYSSRTQQNMPAVLSSIDERLRNLDKLYTYRHANALEQHVRRLETLEAKIESFQSILTSQLDKIEGNMSMQNFKEDIANDQMLRKLDTVYERVHHKMVLIEMKIDNGEKKILEKLETMTQKIDRLEDAVNRKTDFEEVAEVFDALDEMKVSVNAAMANVTQTLGEKFTHIASKLLQAKVEKMLGTINDTNEIIRREFHTSTKVSPLVQEHLQGSIKNLESIMNTTRYEQQNAMRSLVVQVGRLEGKNNMQRADCANGQTATTAAESQQLTNISQKIDDKFDKLMQQQAIFLDSCHRIQSDEPQLESKITEILEKIIDVFEKESTVEIKDIQNIEQLIKSHDTTVRRSLYTTSHNLAVLLQKAKEHKDELSQQVQVAQNSVAEVERKLNVHFLLPNERIFQVLQELKSDLDKFEATGSKVQVQELHNVIREFSENVTEQQRAIDKNIIKIISDELRNVSAKMDDFLNNSYNADTQLRIQLERVEQLLVNYVNNKTRDKDDADDEAALDEAIREIFGTMPNQNSPQDVQDNKTEADDDGIIFTEVNCTSGILDVRTSANCKNCELMPANSNNCTHIISTTTNEAEESDEFDIDLRLEDNDNKPNLMSAKIEGAIKDDQQTKTNISSDGNFAEDIVDVAMHNEGNLTLITST